MAASDTCTDTTRTDPRPSLKSQQTCLPGGLSRRDFVKRTAVVGAGLSVGASAGLMATESFAYAGGRATLRIGLVGCGGRGTGAAKNCVDAAEGVELVAMGDLFADRLDESQETLREVMGEAYQVTGERSFVGWDAYQRVIDSDVDLVLFATPPAFRPRHLRAAVEAGKHVFIEKPVAVDPAGIRSVMESAEQAERQGLALVAGTQPRHDPAYIATMQRIRDGAIGEVVAAQVYWNQGGLWMNERKPGMSDMEWQLRNWLYFTWLSGDHIVEQHVHNLDVANWAIGAHPVRANGVGGRQVRVDPSYGHIFDHFCVELEYPGGARVMSMARQQDGTARHVGEHLIGTEGTSNAHNEIRGASTWTYDGEEANPYVQEHVDLIASIRAGDPLNQGRRIAESVLTAIMAREAAYTGQVVTWEEVLNANLNLVPEDLAFGPMPMPPVAQPGVTPLERSPFAPQTTAAE